MLNNQFTTNQIWLLLLLLSLLSAHFYLRNIVSEPFIDKSWQSQSRISVPEPSKVPEQLVSLYQGLEQKSEANVAIIEEGKFDGAVLADFYITLLGVYQKSEKVTVIAKFQNESGGLSEIKHIRQQEVYNGISLDYASAKEAVFRLGEQTVKLKLFKAAAQPNAVQTPLMQE